MRERQAVCYSYSDVGGPQTPTMSSMLICRHETESTCASEFDVSGQGPEFTSRRISVVLWDGDARQRYVSRD